MYAFDQDENQLLFMDCFGLTRLSRPKQIKSDRKISGSESAGLVSIARDGSTAASYEDLWDKSVLWDMPELRSSTRFDRFAKRGLIMHHDGHHYLVAERGPIVIESLSKGVLLPLRLDAEPDEDDKPAGPVNLSLAGGVQLPALVLGEGQLDVPAPLRLAHDGTLLRWQDDTLIRARLIGTSASVEWRRKISGPDRARLDIHGDAQRTVLVLHRGRHWTIVDHGREHEHSFEIESLAVPAVAGRWLAWQPSPELVSRRNLDSGEISEHSVSIYASKRKFELANEGPGTIFLGAQGSMMFLPEHRESVLDLIKASEVSRGLPAKQLELRQAILAHAQPYLRAARALGANIELGRVELADKYDSVSVTHRIVGGDNLAAALLGAQAQSGWGKVSLPGRWRMGSYGSHGSIVYRSAATLPELLEAYATSTKAGLHFAGTIDFWADLFERRGTGHGWSGEAALACEPAAAALLGQALIAVMRDGPEIELDYAALAKRGAPTAEQLSAALAKYPAHIQQLTHSTTKLTGHLFNQLLGAKAAQPWIRVFLDGEGWPYFGSHYSDFANHAVLPLIEAHGETAAIFRAWFDRNGLPEGDRRWAVEQVYRRLGG